MKTVSEWAKAFLSWAKWGGLDAHREDKHLIRLIEQVQSDAQSPRPPLEEFRLTETELEKIAERHTATMQGVWGVEPMSVGGARYVSCRELRKVSDAHLVAGFGAIDSEMNLPNAEFVAAAHQDIPLLLYDLKQAHALLADMAEDGMGEGFRARLEEAQRLSYERGWGDGEMAALDVMEKERRAINPDLGEGSGPIFEDDVYDFPQL